MIGANSGDLGDLLLKADSSSLILPLEISSSDGIAVIVWNLWGPVFILSYLYEAELEKEEFFYGEDSVIKLFSILLGDSFLFFLFLKRGWSDLLWLYFFGILSNNYSSWRVFILSISEWPCENLSFWGEKYFSDGSCLDFFYFFSFSSTNPAVLNKLILGKFISSFLGFEIYDIFEESLDYLIDFDLEFLLNENSSLYSSLAKESFFFLKMLDLLFTLLVLPSSSYLSFNFSGVSLRN